MHKEMNIASVLLNFEQHQLKAIMACQLTLLNQCRSKLQVS